MFTGLLLDLIFQLLLLQKITLIVKQNTVLYSCFLKKLEENPSKRAAELKERPEKLEQKRSFVFGLPEDAGTLTNQVWSQLHKGESLPCCLF